MWLHAQGLDQVVAERLRLDDRAAESADLSEWLAVVEAAEYPIDEVTIGIVGKYVDHKDAYKSVGEALKHGGIRQRTRVNLKWLESQDIERDGAAKVLEGLDGILVPGGFGDRGFEGTVLAAQYARENGIPYFGICSGMQAAVVDVARNLAGMEDPHSTETDKRPQPPMIGLITDWRPQSGAIESHRDGSELELERAPGQEKVVANR